MGKRVAGTAECADLVVRAPVAVALADAAARAVERRLSEVEEQKVWLARQRAGGASEVARAVHARLAVSPLLDAGPGAGRLALAGRQGGK